MTYDRRVARRTQVATDARPVAAIRKAIELLDYLPNATSEWVEAHAGNRVLAQKHGAKLKEIVDSLGEILVGMPKAVLYEIYGLPDQPSPLVFDNVMEMILALNALGIKRKGTSPTQGRRPEIMSQPVFDKLNGPMYGGGGKVRYEVWYNR